MNTQRSKNAPVPYEIRVAGHLSANWAAHFEGLSMRHEPDGETVLFGMLDQAALHGVFLKVRSLGMNLISVNPVKTTENSNVENKVFQTKGELNNE